MAAGSGLLIVIVPRQNFPGNEKRQANEQAQKWELLLLWLTSIRSEDEADRATQKTFHHPSGPVRNTEKQVKSETSFQVRDYIDFGPDSIYLGDRRYRKSDGGNSFASQLNGHGDPFE